MDTNQLTEGGGFGKAAETLALILKDGCGIIIDPLKLVTTAKAQRYIDRKEIKHKVELLKLELEERAKLRVYETELRRQYNLENIAYEAINYLTEKSQPEKINQDWLHYYIDSCKDTSDELIVTIWAKILTGQMKPDLNISKSTLDVLRKSDVDDCLLFQKLLKYIFLVESNNYGIVFRRPNIAEFDFSSDIDKDDLTHLDDLGYIDTTERDFILFEEENTIYAKNSFSDFLSDKNKTILLKRNEGIKEARIPVYKLTKAGFQIAIALENTLDNEYLSDFLKFVESNNMCFEIKQKNSS